LSAIALWATAANAASPLQEIWIGAWGFPPTSFVASKVTTAAVPPPAAPFDDVTVRQLVRLSHGARRIRIRISNEFGDHPLPIGAAHIARAGDAGATVADSDHALTFDGGLSVSVPPGAAILSDALDWPLAALSQLAISLYVTESRPAPAHRVSEYISSRGNFAVDRSMPGATLQRSGALVSGVEIVSSARHAVVTLGDSITEGFGSTVNEFRGWPDRLAERLLKNRDTRDWCVVNAGINSNRLLHDGPGSGALARFDRDVLSVPGVAAVILLEGINDIGYDVTVPSESVTARDIIGAYRQIIARAHAHGIRVIGATLTPFEGAHYYSPQGEQMRAVLNEWIRSSGEFDAYIDFDATLRDPKHPGQVNPALQRGDQLHPNDAGYAAMADSIPLKIFSSNPRGP
jgi:lysophospholipase L1-like esterase